MKYTTPGVKLHTIKISRADWLRILNADAQAEFMLTITQAAEKAYREWIAKLPDGDGGQVAAR